MANNINILDFSGDGLILLCITVPLSYHLFENKFLKLKDRFRANEIEIVEQEE